MWLICKHCNKKNDIIDLFGVNKKLDSLLAGQDTLKENMMANFDNLNASVSKLGNDVSAEVQAARDAILRVVANPTDQAAIDAATSALDNIDAAVNAATTEFNNAVGTGTTPTP